MMEESDVTKIRKMCIGWHLPSIFWGELEHRGSIFPFTEIKKEKVSLKSIILNLKLSLMFPVLNGSTVCVCVFISFHHKSFSWLNKTINVVPVVQVSDGMLRKYFCIKYLCRHVIDNHSRTFKLTTVQECQLNRAEPREIKDNS